MLTKKQTIALWLCLLNEATQIELPFVIAVFMVRHWLGSEADHEEVVGRMTGLLVSPAPSSPCLMHAAAFSPAEIHEAF